MQIASELETAWPPRTPHFSWMLAVVAVAWLTDLQASSASTKPIKDRRLVGRPNGWRVSGSRRAEGDERVRCTRVLGGTWLPPNNSNARRLDPDRIHVPTDNRIDNATDV